MHSSVYIATLSSPPLQICLQLPWGILSPLLWCCFLCFFLLFSYFGFLPWTELLYFERLFHLSSLLKVYIAALYPPGPQTLFSPPHNLPIISLLVHPLLRGLCNVSFPEEIPAKSLNPLKPYGTLRPCLSHLSSPSKTWSFSTPSWPL